MKVLLKISWLNVWRNTRRSLVMIVAVSIGLWGGIFVSALSSGMMLQRFDLSVKQHISHIQVQNPEFLKDRHIKYGIADWDALQKALKADSLIDGFSGRTLAGGMLATANMTVGISIVGIDAASEAATTALDENILQGNYIVHEGRNPVLVGKKLADKTKLQPGSRLVLTFQNVEGELVSASFRVAGIYQTSNGIYDESHVYVRQSDLEPYVGEGTTINQVAIIANKMDQVQALGDRLTHQFPEYSIRTWVDISPELAYMQEMAGMMLMIILVIILFALSFGLVNTMLMSVFERTRELGMLMAVGMNSKKVFAMIMIETIFLTLMGALGGMLLGFVSIQFFSKTGIDMAAVGGDSLNNFGFPSVVYPQLELSFFFFLMVLVIVTAVLTSIYPALKALRLKPAEAVRKE
jgi:putative ABC transport system permease protein